MYRYPLALGGPPPGISPSGGGAALVVLAALALCVARPRTCNAGLKEVELDPSGSISGYPIPPEQWKKLNRSVLNRMGMAEDIAGTIIFLASNLGNFITGEDIYVDGGETLHMGHDARDMINPDMFDNRERGDGKDE